MILWLVIVGVVLGLCIAEWIRELYTFKITHYEIKSQKLNGLRKERKVLFLSDLHNNRYGKNNEKLLEAIRNLNPDMIFVGGDMIVGLPDASMTVAEEFVKELVTICPVYYANGNHEQRIKIYPEKFGTMYERYKSSLLNSGVNLIENSHVDLQWDSCEVRLYGVEIPAKGYKKFRKMILETSEIAKCVGDVDTDKYNILLAHNPHYAETYVEWGADLTLSGHLHGGVVRIPFVGGVISPQFRLFPKYSGEHKKVGEQSVVVSKGLGTHTIKVRFMNPAEIVVLHMGGTHGNTC